MKTIEDIKDPVEQIWAIREKIYEETKDMTAEEISAYRQRSVDRFYAEMNSAKSCPDSFRWLTGEKETV